MSVSLALPRLLALGLLTLAACDRLPVASPAAADDGSRAKAEVEAKQRPTPGKLSLSPAPAGPASAVAEVAAPEVTKPDAPESLAVFFSVSNRGELDPCG